MNPFVKLLREDIVWSWSRECEAAFQKAKASLASYDVLTYFDPNLPVKLTCDASLVRVGAVISHRINGIDRPIAYASKALSAAERNYSQLDKEALASIFGVKHFHQYLYGREFELETDHKPWSIFLALRKEFQQWQQAHCSAGV